MDVGIGRQSYFVGWLVVLRIYVALAAFTNSAISRLGTSEIVATRPVLFRNKSKCISSYLLFTLDGFYHQ